MSRVVTAAPVGGTSRVASTSRNASTSRASTATARSTFTYRPKTQRRMLKAKKRATPPPRGLTLAALVVRQRCDPSSQKIGTISTESVVYLADTREMPDTGVKRARVAVARDNAAPKGWVTVYNEGKWLIRIDGGEDVISKIVWKPWRQKGTSRTSDEGTAPPLVTAENIGMTFDELNALAQEQLRLAAQAAALVLSANTLPAKLGKALHDQKISVDEVCSAASSRGPSPLPRDVGEITWRDDAWRDDGVAVHAPVGRRRRRHRRRGQQDGVSAIRTSFGIPPEICRPRRPAGNGRLAWMPNAAGAKPRQRDRHRQLERYRCALRFFGSGCIAERLEPSRVAELCVVAWSGVDVPAQRSVARACHLADKGGALDLGELKAAFKRLAALAANSIIVAAAAKARAARLKRLAGLTQAAADATAAADQAERGVAEAADVKTGSATIEARLGAFLAKRGTDVSKVRPL